MLSNSLQSSQLNSLKNSKTSNFTKEQVGLNKITVSNSKNKLNLINLNHNLIRNESRGTGTVINKLSPMVSMGIANKKQNNILSLNERVDFPDTFNHLNKKKEGNEIFKRSTSKRNVTQNNQNSTNTNKYTTANYNQQKILTNLNNFNNFNNFMKKVDTNTNKFLKSSVNSIGDSSFSHRIPSTTKNGTTLSNFSNFANLSNRTQIVQKNNLTNPNEINILNSFDGVTSCGQMDTQTNLGSCQANTNMNKSSNFKLCSGTLINPILAKKNLNLDNSLERTEHTTSGVSGVNTVNINSINSNIQNDQINSMYMSIKDKVPNKLKEKVNNIRLYTKPQILVEDTISPVLTQENEKSIKSGHISPQAKLFKNTGNLNSLNKLNTISSVNNFIPSNLSIKNSNLTKGLNSSKNLINPPTQKLSKTLNLGQSNLNIMKTSVNNFNNNKNQINQVTDLAERKNLAQISSQIANSVNPLKRDLNEAREIPKNNFNIKKEKDILFKQIKDKIKKISEKGTNSKLFLNNVNQVNQNNNRKEFSMVNGVNHPTLKNNKTVNFSNMNHTNSNINNYNINNSQIIYGVKLPNEMSNLDKEFEYDKIFSSIKEEDIFKNELKIESRDKRRGSTPAGSSHSKDESGVLTYDEVKDIIQCLDFKNYDVKDRNVYTRYDYEKFSAISRTKYTNALFNIKSDVEIIMDSNKSCSTKDSSSNKKNFISVTKLLE